MVKLPETLDALKRRLPTSLDALSGRVPAIVRSWQLEAYNPEDEVPEELMQRVQKPIRRGLFVLIVFGFGSFGWAAYAKISGAIVAPGFVRIEENRKVIKSRDGGIVREINVKEGETVAKGQILIRMDETAPRSQYEVMRNVLDGLLVQRARFQAERDGAESITLPPELESRRDTPQIQALMRDQNNLFESRRASLAGDLSVLSKRMDQLDTRITGITATLGSLDKQSALIKDELSGVEYLFSKSLVPKTRLLSLQRSAAEIEGNRGTQTSEITRTKESQLETQLQMRSVQQRREAEVNESLRDTQGKIAEVEPRLRAAEEALGLVEVKSPVDGYVLSLTQFTKDGVVTPGERLLDIVPTSTPLLVEAHVKPDEAYEVTRGMPALIQFSTHEARSLAPVAASVTNMSADRIQDPRTGDAYFTVEVSITPDVLKSLPSDIRIYPGMSATAMIGTGERSILAYLVNPVKDSLRGALKER